MRRNGIAATLLALAAGVAAALAPSEAPKPIADRDFSLARGSVFEVQAPPPVAENTTDPGEGPLPGRAHAEMPPVVPHGIADFLPITRSDNACIDCHAVAEKEPGEPTPIPPSHFVDFRRAPDRPGEKLAGARWVCVSCHVARTGAEPLVANRFEAKPPAPPEPPE